MTYQSIFNTLWVILYQTGKDILFLSIPLFTFGLILYFLSKWTRNSFKNSGLEKLDVYATGIIGVPIHEIGHLIFCILFGHKITKVHLFKPSASDLGSVDHSYNPKNVIHRVGNFFISVGPIIFGSCMLWLLANLLLNISFKELIKTGSPGSSDWLHILKTIPEHSYDLTYYLYTTIDWNTPLEVLFVYLSLSIASHMELSPADLSGMVSGLITILIIIFCVNCVLVFSGFSHTYSTMIFNTTIQPVYTFFIYAVAVSSVGFCSVFTFTTFYSLIVKKSLVNPFR